MPDTLSAIYIRLQIDTHKQAKGNDAVFSRTFPGQHYYLSDDSATGMATQFASTIQARFHRYKNFLILPCLQRCVVQLM